MIRGGNSKISRSKNAKNKSEVDLNFGLVR